MKMLSPGFVLTLGLLASLGQASPANSGTSSNSDCKKQGEDFTVDYKRNCGAVDTGGLLRLDKDGACASVSLMIEANSPWNASGILFEKDVSYRVEVTPVEKEPWCDGLIESGPEGWQTSVLGECEEKYSCPNKKGEKSCKRPVVPFSFVGFPEYLFINGTLFLRREAFQNWSYLMGAVAAEKLETFPIGNGASDDGKGNNPHIKPKHSGEFCSFANDLHFMYENNSGRLKLTITRISD